MGKGEPIPFPSRSPNHRIPSSRERAGWLMERIHGGDRAAMDELVALYWDRLVSFGGDITGSRESAEDVVQEVFLNVWQGRTSWTPTDRLQAFLYRMTRNGALNHVRNRKTRRRLLSGFETWRQRPPRPDEESEARRVAGTVVDAIRALPSRRREIFVLSRFHGHSYREISEILEISPQTVANQMSSALDALRTALAPLRGSGKGGEDGE
jgi:RNA polymerase sigma-70 factor, ECF subfamily